MLVPCAACGRHLRGRESRCPFCLAAHVPVELAEPAAPRLSRAALAVAGSLVLGGCPMAVRYGGPPVVAVPADPAPTDGAAAAATSDATVDGARGR